MGVICGMENSRKTVYEVLLFWENKVFPLTSILCYGYLYRWYVRRKSVGKFNISELNIYNKIENNNNKESKNKFQNMKTTPAAFRSRKNNKIHDTFITPLLFDALLHITHHSLNSYSLSITFSLFIYIFHSLPHVIYDDAFQEEKIYIFPSSSSSSPYFWNKILIEFHLWLINGILLKFDFN